MFKLHDPIDSTAREALSGYDDLTASLLVRRGVTNAKAAQAFLAPSYDEHIGDPMMILNMPKAAKRIADAIDSKERIAVWSDYDCDGIPGGVLFHDFLKKAGAHFTNYIPHRHDEGFGLNKQGLKKLADEGAGLVITIDCGIADVENVAYANELGLEVIVTDHHLPGETLPPAFAVLDPKQEGETNDFKDFCGAGLAWKLACAVLQHGFKGREDIPPGWEKWLLDMAGLATIADMVPLHGENRVIAKYGLVVLRKSPRLGLQRLCKAAGVYQSRITEDDVGFMLAPRINAASRMGNPRDAFTLFTTTDEVEAETLAKLLEKTNRSRRAAGAAVTRAVHERIEERKMRGEELPPVIAMGDPEWRPGLLGLVANSLAEEYARPVFLWGREGTMSAKGSCRAGRKDVDVVELMQAADNVFVECGGHSQSGGFSVKDDAIFFLEERLVAAYQSLPKRDKVLQLAAADAEFTFSESAAMVLSRIEKFAPFGMQNPKPSFRFQDVVLAEVSWFGKSNEHLRLKIAPDAFSRMPLEAISFFAKRELGKSCENLEQGSTANIVANLERDQFTRRGGVRLRIIAIS
jgi:single-stranded-DNA-specific exonuclease